MWKLLAGWSVTGNPKTYHLGSTADFDEIMSATAEENINFSHFYDFLIFPPFIPCGASFSFRSTSLC